GELERRAPHVKLEPRCSRHASSRRSRSASFRIDAAYETEQAPGPRGSPQTPHARGEEAKEGADALLVLTANTDSCFSRSVLAQTGQLGVWPWRDSCSNR